MQSFYRESLLWKNLEHENVLPFLGVTEDVFKDSICMVIPWMEHGSLRHYLDHQRSSGSLVGDQLVFAIENWVSYF